MTSLDKPLCYLIGAHDPGPGAADVLTEVPYGEPPVQLGTSIGYCNLFDELNTGRYGPYLRTSDTARDYDEGQIDPRGPGWRKNLVEQFALRKRQGFEFAELDNADAYSIEHVIGAIELAASFGLKVIAKNPDLMESGAARYVAHANVYGVIVERSAGSPAEMEELRRKAGKPGLPVWFVAFGSGRAWAERTAKAARGLRNMYVSHSRRGEYGSYERVT